jgi:hypothetical protein
LREVAYDYDQCIYFVSRDQDAEIVKFAFSCNCTKQILANGGEQMLNDLYAGNPTLYSYSVPLDNILPKEDFVPDYDITLGIDASKLPKTQSKISSS